MRVALAVVIAVGCGDNKRPVAPDTPVAPDAVAPDAQPMRRALCVTNADDTVEVFDALQDGDGAPLRRFGRITLLESASWIAVDPAHDEVFVADVSRNAILVYGRTANGGVAPIRELAGPTTMIQDPWALAVDTVNDELVVVDQAPGFGYVTVYPRAAAGDVAPTRNIDVAYAFLRPHMVAVDPVHDELVLTGDNAVAVYPRTASGGPMPSRLITGVASPLGVAVDPAHDEIFVASGSAVAIYPRLATGAAPPLRTIAGPSTGLGTIVSIGVDTASDELVVSDHSTLSVFPRTASGDVAPTRTIIGATPGALSLDTVHGEIAITIGAGISAYASSASGAAAPLRTVSDDATWLNMAHGIAADLATGEVSIASPGAHAVAVFGDAAAPSRTLESLPYPSAVAIDTVHDEIAVASYVDGTPHHAEVTVYPRIASGAASPIRTIAPAVSDTFANTVGGIAIDTVNDEIAVANLTSAPSVCVFARTADGAVAPLRRIATPYDVTGVAVDPVHDEIVVATDAIRVYARTADGTDAPERSIRPPGYVTAVAVDPSAGEIFVADNQNSAIAVYARAADGDAAPLRTVSGPQTLLNRPMSIALCRAQ